MINTLFRQRTWFLLVFVLCAALLGYAYYQQYAEMLIPCPLCILQRVAFVAMGMLALIAAIHNPHGIFRWIYALLVILSGVAGASVAGRHVWLQSLPADQVPDCGPSLGYMMQNFPLGEVWQTVFHGSGSCAEVDWTFLGLSMPSWTLIWYLVFISGTLFVMIKHRGRHG